MSHILRFAIVVVSLAQMPAVAHAQEVLTVERAVQDAAAQNAALRAARAGVAVGESGVAEARAGWLPRVSFTETWQRGNQPVFVFSSLLAARRFEQGNFALPALNNPDAIGAYRSALSVEQIVFDGGRQPAAVQRARLRHDLAQIGLDETSAALALTTVQTYGRILMSEAAERAAVSALAAANQDMARARDRRDAGVATDADVLALVAHAADLQQRAIAHRGDAAIARAELNRLTGAPVTRQFAVIRDPVVQNPAASDQAIDALLAEAERNRPELRRAAAAQQLAEADRRHARAALLPQVVARGGVEISGIRFGSRESSWVAGADVRWSLSLGGAEVARVRAAREARARADAEADDLRAAVQVEVVTAYRRLEAAAARGDVSRAALEQARESHRIMRDRYEAGLATVTDVLRASSAVLDAEAQSTSAAVDALVSKALLSRAVGRRP